MAGALTSILAQPVQVNCHSTFDGKAKFLFGKQPPFMEVFAFTDQAEIWFREFPGFAVPTGDGSYKLLVATAEPGKIHGQTKETVDVVTVKIRVK